VNHVEGVVSVSGKVAGVTDDTVKYVRIASSFWQVKFAEIQQGHGYVALPQVFQPYSMPVFIGSA
jgi:hypothetical protein